MRELHAVIDFSAGAEGLRPLRLAFGTPTRELFAWTFDEVRAVLGEVHRQALQGNWSVGYLRYEAGGAFESTATLHPPDGPLAYFSVHEQAMDLPELSGEPSKSIDWEPQISRDGFDAAVETIRTAIANGEVYQVNYTSTLKARWAGDAFGLFCALRRAQPASNAAYLSNSHESVLSVSPELFFDWQADTLQCRPMKGTAARGATPDLDRRNAQRLRDSAKERAENVMIVDLIRNDMSRIAQLGSVRVTRLFDCDAWPTVWQMTSTVVACTQPDTTLLDVFAALFPCGSVTGAPKLRAMHWIKALEPHPRGIYCGAVGVVQPGGSARFNVPIRTVTVRDGIATCGIGSGITADSTDAGEWAEWTSKSMFLRQASQPFRLLQTIRCEDGQLRSLELHLERLAAAGEHFGFAFRRDLARSDLEQAAAAQGRGSRRVRVTVDVRGAVGLEVSDLPHTPRGPLPVTLAHLPVDAPAPAFLQHKTTRRSHLAPFAAGTEAAFDTLMWNSRGEVTEFTRGNVIVQRGSGELVTPPLHCGLLDGVGRARELQAGQIREAVVRLEDLGAARQIWFVNALRGLVPVFLTARP